MALSIALGAIPGSFARANGGFGEALPVGVRLVAPVGFVRYGFAGSERLGAAAGGSGFWFEFGFGFGFGAEGRPTVGGSDGEAESGVGDERLRLGSFVMVLRGFDGGLFCVFNGFWVRGRGDFVGFR